jgi:thiol:disulfide interchange protein DsbG
LKRSFHWIATLFAALLVACSPAETPPKAISPNQALDAVMAQGKGFSVGAVMSANTVYVLFDPQCPHCGHLWAAAQPLQSKAKFVWIPVAIINGNSAPQGAALLGAPSPVEAMNLHEASILAGTGGTVARGGMPADLEAIIKKNTELFNSLKLESVPFLVGRNAKTGQAVSNSGAMDSGALAQLLGLN